MKQKFKSKTLLMIILLAIFMMIPTGKVEAANKKVYKLENLTFKKQKAGSYYFVIKNSKKKKKSMRNPSVKEETKSLYLSKSKSSKGTEIANVLTHDMENVVYDSGSKMVYYDVFSAYSYNKTTSVGYFAKATIYSYSIKTKKTKKIGTISLKNIVNTSDFSIRNVYGKYLYYSTTIGIPFDNTFYAMNMKTGKKTKITSYMKTKYSLRTQYMYTIGVIGDKHIHYIPSANNRYMMFLGELPNQKMAVLDCKTAKLYKSTAAWTCIDDCSISQLSNGKWAVLERGDSQYQSDEKDCLYVLSSNGKTRTAVKKFWGPDTSYDTYIFGGVYKDCLYYAQKTDYYNYDYYKYDIVKNKITKVSVNNWRNFNLELGPNPY